MHRLVAFRRDLHQHPELSWNENRTADRICEQLDRLGIVYRRDVAQTGIVADIPGGANRYKVALRADMDGLPVFEKTDLEFSSVNNGVMHACGHDAHMTMVLGATELLSQESDLPAPVRVIFQPAEEKGTGAIAMIEDGALEGVAMIFGGHVDRNYSTGTIVAHAGVVNASTDSFQISVSGTGGHAARPHECVDSVVVGSLLIMALQTIVSREVNPANSAVVTVGRFDAGTAPNVIAGKAVLEGTIRSQDNDVRQKIITALQRICHSMGQLHDAKISVKICPGTLPVINTPEMAEIAQIAGISVVGQKNTIGLQTPNMGGEDFSYFMEKVRGCYIRLGVRAKDRESFPAHSSKFDIDEAVLPIGARFFYQVALVAGTKIASEGK